MPPPQRQIRARYDESTITVYQAYSPAIADPAVAAGRFVPPFKLDRMTWIKPSFLWMMYRSGWGTKPGQERVLAVRMTREGFEEALAKACLSHFDADVYPDHDTWLAIKDRSPVRIQWDPERDTNLKPLPWRSIQIGLSGEAARNYARTWVVGIEDITDLARTLSDPEQRGSGAWPVERPYPVPDAVARAIGMDLTSGPGGA